MAVEKSLAPEMEKVDASGARPQSSRERLGFVGYLLQRAGIRIGLKYGGSFFYPSEDRTVLENLVLPYYQISPDHQRILFVGTSWPTHGYVRMFSHKSLFTLDLDPEQACFGGPQHIVGSITSLDRHFSPQSLDLIVVNGVVGWGLDTADDVEQAIAGCARCLRPGGHLVVGWNDLDAHSGARLKSAPSMAKFGPFTMPPLGKHVVLVEGAWRHVYQFYELLASPTIET